MAVTEADVVVIGGGPAGTAAASLLASRGHSVVLLTQPFDWRRELANSLPPSTRKLLAATGLFRAVDRVGLKTAGNTVWWGAGDRRVSPFDPTGQAWGYQVLRSVLDPLLMARARASGVRTSDNTVVSQVSLEQGRAVIVGRTVRGATVTAVGRMVLDCSGRSGVIARRGFRRSPPDVRMQALLGSWERSPWDAPDDTDTVVETCDDGWAWSIPVSRSIRHVGIMIDGSPKGMPRGSSLAATYRRELAKARQLSALVSTAALTHVWACDASVYASSEYATAGCLLVGDAGSSIDPLSSYGVKKALASAWLASIVAHTCLIDEEREAAALQFFSDWERKVYRTHTDRSRAFALEARARHGGRFWEQRASAPDSGPAAMPEGDGVLQLPIVVAAYERMRTGPDRAVRRDLAVPFASVPLVRDGEIVLADAVVVPGAAPLRYVRDIDLTALAALASPRAIRVPDMFEAYCARVHAAPLSSFLGAVAVLIAARVLAAEPASA